MHFSISCISVSITANDQRLISRPSWPSCLRSNDIVQTTKRPSSQRPNEHRVNDQTTIVRTTANDYCANVQTIMCKQSNAHRHNDQTTIVQTTKRAQATDFECIPRGCWSIPVTVQELLMFRADMLVLLNKCVWWSTELDFIKYSKFSCLFLHLKMNLMYFFWQFKMHTGQFQIYGSLAISVSKYSWLNCPWLLRTTRRPIVRLFTQRNPA